MMLRTATLDVEYRSNGLPRLVGHAAVFNQLSNVLSGYFRERILRGAFTRTLRKGDPVYCLLNHNPDICIASTNDGSLKLSEDSIGLLAEIEPMDTPTIRDLVVKPIQEGKLNKMSFAFDVPDGGDLWSYELGAAVRSVRDANLYDVAPVAFPAYPGTDISARAHSLSLVSNNVALVELYRMRLRRHQRLAA